jgi:hypothetical protein
MGFTDKFEARCDEALKSRLWDGETVLRIDSGSTGMKRALVALTDQRIVFFFQGTTVYSAPGIGEALLEDVMTASFNAGGMFGANNALMVEARSGTFGMSLKKYKEGGVWPNLILDAQRNLLDSGAPEPSMPERVAPTTMPEFDPQGPEKAASAAKDAYNEHDWARSFELYVKAVDRLHDFYVYEQFRNRQPSPGDAWIVNGLVSALGVLRDQDPTADVAAGVKEATHRLRTIASALEAAGGNATLYRGGLDGLAQYAPDVDVSAVFWT